MFEWTDTAALRTWIVRPNCSSLGNFRVSRYTSFASSIAFCHTNRSVKSRIAVAMILLFLYLPLAPRPLPLIKYPTDPINLDIPILQKLREEEVFDDDRDETQHKSFRTRAPDPRGAAPAGKAFVATDQADAGAKKHTLENPFEDLPVVHALSRVVPIRSAGHAKRSHGD